LYIGGGNSKEVDVGLLPANVTIISNLNGLIGGIALWRDESVPPSVPAQPVNTTATGRPLAA
jgi:hypothetical protein